MKYLHEILKAVLAIAVFIIAAYKSSIGYESIVIVCLGLIYVVISIGITRLQLQQYQTVILNTRMQLNILRSDDNPYYKNEINNFDMHLSHYYDELEKIGIALVVHYISGGLIFSGCVYLIYQSLTV